MHDTEAVTFTNMCMVCSGNKVLVQDRRDPAWPGVTVPGGHVEQGEFFTEAVIREVWEETGLTISAPRRCGIKDWYSDNQRYVVLLYRADCFTGELCSSEEGEVWWAELEKLTDLSLASDMEIMLRVFVEDELSEFFYRQDGEKWFTELK